LTISALFSRKPTSTKLSISYLEVYNETIRDLLSPRSTLLDLREEEGIVHVANLSSSTLVNETQALELVRRGNEKRTCAATRANSVSSRSHAVIVIRVVGESCRANLTIVDLAGSERACATSNNGERMVEGIVRFSKSFQERISIKACFRSVIALMR
jgi:kinesin family protein 18/19